MPARRELGEATLSAKSRSSMSDSSFALPGRRYPIHDESHAANALARVAQHGTPEEKAKVRAAVCRKYPNMGVCKEAKKMKEAGLDPNSPEGATLLLERIFRQRVPALRRRLEESIAAQIDAASAGDKLAFVSARARSDELRRMLRELGEEPKPSTE
jgi:hypothetical protein